MKKDLFSLTQAPALNRRQMCQLDFYKGVLSLQAGNQDAFHDMMGTCSSYGRAVAMEQEYHIATFELDP